MGHGGVSGQRFCCGDDVEAVFRGEALIQLSLEREINRHEPLHVWH